MHNKTILITGATSGIGFETAKTLAEKGAKVIGVGSRESSCLRAKNKLKKKNILENIEFISCDFSEKNNILKLRDRLITNYSNIDVLINNAGVILLKKSTNSNGIEKTIFINYLSHFLLTRLLLDNNKLQNSRIINVSSIAYEKAEIEFENLNLSTYHWMKAYRQSKLALILFTKILANKLNEKNITVNSIHPGLIGTNLLSKNGWISPFLNILLKLFGKSTKTGAKGLIYLATSDDIKQLTGKYFEGVNITKLLNHADDMKSAKKLWDISSKLCGLNTDLLID